jgi:hypothetical protein
MRSQPWLLAAALLAPAAGAADAGAAFELRCEREMQPVFDVQARAADFDVSNTVSSQVLNTRHSYASVGQLALGLTAGTARFCADRRECYPAICAFSWLWSRPHASDANGSLSRPLIWTPSARKW